MSQDYDAPDDWMVRRETLIPAFGRDALAYAIAAGIPAVVSVVLVAVCTRVFSPREFGQYSLALTTVTICVSLLSSWLQQSILRFRPMYIERGARRDFDRNLIILLGGLTLGVVVAGSIGWPILRPVLGSYRRFYSLGVGLLVSGLWIRSLGVVLQSDLRSREYSLYQMAQSALRLLLSLVWIFLIARDVTGLLWGVLLVQVVAIAPMGVSLGFHRVRLTRKAAESPFVRFAGQFLRYGGPIVGWVIGAELLDLSDRYLLQAFRGSTEVGIYAPVSGVARAILALATGPLIVAARAFLMKAAGGGEIDTPRLQTIVSELSRFFLIIAIPAAAYVIVFSREIVTVFLGPDYRAGFTIIPLIVVGFVAWRFSMYGHKGFEFLRKTRRMFEYVMICAAVNVLLNLYFIPRYGYSGAAVTTLISSLLYPALVYFGSKREFAWRIPWASMARILLAGVSAAGGAYLVKWAIGAVPIIPMLVIGFVVLSVVYGVVLLAIREVSREELRLLWQAIRSSRWASHDRDTQ